MEAAAVATKLMDGSVDQLLGELLSRAKNRFKFVVYLRDEICFLRDVLPKLKEVILSAEVKPETAELHRALHHFSEDAEDILDEFDTETAQCGFNQAADRRPNRFKKPVFKVRGLIPSRFKFVFKIKGLYDGLEKMERDIHQRRRFVASAEEGLRLTKKEGEGEIELPRRPVTDELLSKDFLFVGREKMKEEVMAELLSEPLSKPSVVLIIGMGGIGKTTFVQDIFRQPVIVKRFHKFKKWVCVGDELDPETVMGAILDKEKGDRMEIFSELESKSFLIVLDDCWSGKLKRWKELWVPLTHGSDGSKVIITSRMDISKELVPASVKPYQLGILSDNECLQIFESYAFPVGVPSTSSGCDSTSRLREIGKEIVEKKIKGLPLAAMVLGSSLCYEKQESAWNNALTGVSEADDNIMSVLMWSYRRLPSHLKQCFAYLSLLPKDFKFKKEEVVRMWIHAKGILGKSYFDYLVRAFLIQKMNMLNGVKDGYYNMHDLVHDLAINVIGGSYFPNYIVATLNYVHQKAEDTRHLLIEESSSSDKYSYNSKLQTLLNYCDRVDSSKFQLQHVRALSLPWNQDLTRINFSTMIHLRYLDLTRVKANTLPESICSIYNLQTLLLNDDVENFPLGKWNLPNLCTLMGGKHIRMTGIGNSASLQTLNNFNFFIGGEDIEELGTLKELRGRLKINHLEYVQNPQSASEVKLDNKEYIEELVLNWEDPIDNEDSTRMKVLMQHDILEKLCPHGNLRILKIARYMGNQSPSWMTRECLVNLVELELSHLHYIKELPPLGHLPMLGYLRIENLRNIRCICNEFYGTEAHAFPSLKRLYLMNMDGLEEWMDSTYHEDRITKWFPSLQDLDIMYCKELRSLPRLPRNLTRLYIDSTRLEVLPDIWTCSDDSAKYELPRLEALRIKDCPSLCPDKWFQKYRMPSLHKLTLITVGRCTNLIINHFPKCLRELNIWSMRALRSITLSNLVPLEEFHEAEYQELSVELHRLNVLEYTSTINCEEEKIAVGPLDAVRCNQASMLQENASKFMVITNVVYLSTDNWGFLLKVDPRKLVELDLHLSWDIDVEVPYHYQKRLWMWFRNLSSIQKLKIYGHYLREKHSWPPYLPLHNLSSLKYLEFMFCKHALESFPELPPSLKKEGLKFYM